MFKDNLWNRIKLPGSDRHLAVIRVAFGCYILYLTLLDGNLQILKELSPTNNNPDSTIPDWFEAIAWEHFAASVYITSIACVGMIVGFCTRLSIALTSIGFHLLYSNLYSITYYHNEWPYFWFPLLLLFLTNPSQTWSVDSWIRKKRNKPEKPRPENASRWPLELSIGWFGLVYFCAGVAKITPIQDGIIWIKGGTTQWLTMTRYFDSPSYWLFDSPMFDYTQLWPFTLLSIMTLMLELSGILLLFSRKLYLPVYLCIIALHVGILATTGMPGFMRTVFVFGLFLIPSHWFRDISKDENKMSRSDSA